MLALRAQRKHEMQVWYRDIKIFKKVNERIKTSLQASKLGWFETTTRRPTYLDTSATG